MPIVSCTPYVVAVSSDEFPLEILQERDHGELEVNLASGKFAKAIIGQFTCGIAQGMGTDRSNSKAARRRMIPPPYGDRFSKPTRTPKMGGAGIISSVRR